MNINNLEWLELLRWSLQSKKDKISIEDLIELVEGLPNDAQLGEELRKLINHYKKSTSIKK
jgi:hypothetical protein